MARRRKPPGRARRHDGRRRRDRAAAAAPGGVQPDPAAPPAAASLRGGLPFILLIVAAGWAAFAPALDNQFVHWDDMDNYVHNAHIRSLSVENLRWMARSELIGVWQPLAWFVTAAEYQLFDGENLPSFRRGIQYVSLVSHLLAAILCYFLAAHLLARALPGRPGFSPPALRLGAALAAGLFAVHPLRAEVVAWASGQPYALATVGCLAAVLCYLRAARTNRRRWHAAALLCLAGALACKSIAAPLVAILFLLDVYPLRRMALRPGPGGIPPGRLLREKIPYLVLTLAAIVFAARANLATPDYQPDPPLIKALVVSFCLARYAVMTFSPLGLAPYYARPHPLETLLTNPAFLAAAAAVIGLTLLAVGLRRRLPGLAAAWFAFILLAAPVSGLVLHGGQLAANRYTYLAGIPWAVLAGAVLARLGSVPTGPRRARRLAARSVIALCAVGLLALGIRSRAQCRVWHDSITLLTEMVRHNPNWPNGPYYLAKRHREADNLSEAERLYRRAIEIYPEYPEANINLAILLQARGDLDEAEAHYRRALSERPRFHMAHYNLGCLLMQRGAYPEAAEHFAQAEADAQRHNPALLPRIRQRLLELRDIDAVGP